MPAIASQVSFPLELKRYLVLADGTCFEGKALGTDNETVGEVVFNTGMTGYQEILTDPSYSGQLVTFTYPMIGNYGINEDDFESSKLQAAGIIVGEACETPSNWRSTKTIDALLKERGLTGIQGLDTRALTRKIRSAGVTMGALANSPEAAKEALANHKSYDETDFVYNVTTKIPYAWGPEGLESIEASHEGYKLRLVVLDCGLKYNILRRFASAGCRCIVLPATAPAEEVLAWEPDGILLSPGPGDPARLEPVVETVKALLGKKPMFGICLGNQLLAQAVGGRTYKLKFGHRGSNHPVKDLKTGKVTITSQNHGYAVDPDSLVGTGAEVTQLNLNDGSVEGIAVPELMARSIQYHPEAAPGPWDSRPYFLEFVEQMEMFKQKGS